jgi:hypothetical protein
MVASSSSIRRWGFLERQHSFQTPTTAMPFEFFELTRGDVEYAALLISHFTSQ